MVANLLTLLPFALTLFAGTASAAPSPTRGTPPFFQPTPSWETREIPGADSDVWKLPYRATRQTVPDWTPSPASARRSRLFPMVYTSRPVKTRKPVLVKTAPTNWREVLIDPRLHKPAPTNWREFFTNGDWQVYGGVPYNVAAHPAEKPKVLSVPSVPSNEKRTVLQLMLAAPKDAVKWVVRNTPKEVWYGLLWMAVMKASHEYMAGPADTLDLAEVSELLVESQAGTGGNSVPNVGPEVLDILEVTGVPAGAEATGPISPAGAEAVGSIVPIDATVEAAAAAEVEAWSTVDVVPPVVEVEVVSAAAPVIPAPAPAPAAVDASPEVVKAVIVPTSDIGTVAASVRVKDAVTGVLTSGAKAVSDGVKAGVARLAAAGVRDLTVSAGKAVGAAVNDALQESQAEALKSAAAAPAVPVQVATLPAPSILM